MTRLSTDVFDCRIISFQKLKPHEPAPIKYRVNNLTYEISVKESTEHFCFIFLLVLSIAFIFDFHSA